MTARSRRSPPSCLAIALGLLTFGTGTVAVLAGGALLAQGVYLASEDIKAYGEAFAAAHTAFDPATRSAAIRRARSGPRSR